jgi:hypothetical protein
MMKKTRSEAWEELVEATCVRSIESWTVILKTCDLLESAGKCTSQVELVAASTLMRVER